MFYHEDNEETEGKTKETTDCAGFADLERKERRKLWEYSREGVDS